MVSKKGNSNLNFIVVNLFDCLLFDFLEVYDIRSYVLRFF
ncbi:hypothetical protein LEP1GSC021_4874 [Leptospira noguchii str. 1993005606]|uniref:Uncharacterized protein n=2 Tax=Leptospira noguchii TaxID=28182 RepID=M6Y1T6_9LEPT|nr:hypothetical protein LEP1GSC035_1524 [Leptospira noguchii str. 2007001578]EMO88297.1 hypothetical protein LEP1GSC024_3704 [Leptospira noguchii str. 2001034031]EPE85174.1 hypothetical protein LEP1GSC021_4874 [Leptospira noguchii str. 1993005606]